MGGNRFFTRQSGVSIAEAYRDAVSIADQEHGHQQGYSGEINSTGGFINLTEEWKKSKLNYNAFITKKEEGTLTKGNAYGLCIKEPKKNNNKIKSQVEHNVEKGTKKWVLKYVVSTLEQQLGTGYKTKGEALKFARAHTEKTGRRTYIDMEKVLEKGSTKVATITYKGSKDESKGDYIFFGIAPC